MGLARTFRLLNCQNDGELEELLAKLEALATSPIPKNGRRRREVEPIEGLLEKIARLTHASAEEVKRRSEPSRFRALEV
ncbi:MAG: hypothetical protein Q8P22_00445 [Chloroflexota bacterium]|nr:hypothetical protein [Chloroflexota bacterium]